MNYRDDRDALRGRIEGLEQDLEEARREQEADAAKRARINQVEARMRETEENLRAMRAELEALGAAPQPKEPKQPRTQNNSQRPLIVGIIAVSLFAIVAGFSVARRTARPYTQVQPPPTFTPAFTSAPIPEIPTDDPLQPPGPRRQVKAQWDGKITKIQSFGGLPGSPCVVTATLESSDGDGRVADLSVYCNNKPIYQSTDQINGVSSTGYAIGEGPGKLVGTYAYVLNYSDIGARSGPRTQVSIDTTHGQGVVWSDIVPVFRVEFSVNKQSDSVKGEALLPAKKNDPFQYR